MIREFDWRDLGVVHRLAPKGLCLHAETGLTRGVNSAVAAVKAYVAPGHGMTTLVARAGNQEHEMFAQFRVGPQGTWAQIHYIAPRPRPDDQDDWVEMLEYMLRQSAERGAAFLVAQVDDETTEYEVFRRVRFTNYTHQLVWRYAGPVQTEAPAGTPDLQPVTDDHQLGVNLLFQQIVPKLVQQVHPTPQADDGYVWIDEGEVSAFFDVVRGPLGVWVRPYVHPQAQPALDGLLQALLHALHQEGPIYVGYHSYQGGLQGALEAQRFEPWASQVLMVKRMGVGVLTPAFSRVREPGTVPTHSLIRPESPEEQREPRT